MQTPTTRYPCCDHCPDESCPRMAGHPLPCGTPDCYSDTPIMEQYKAPVPTTITENAIEDIMGWRADHRITELREELFERITEIVGYEPPGVRVLMRTLTHPNMLSLTKEYLELLDPTNKCLEYESPWSCIREAEARYENIRHGWLGGHGVGFDESWCENCRSKILGTPVPDNPEVVVETALDILKGSDDDGEGS